MANLWDLAELLLKQASAHSPHLQCGCIVRSSLTSMSSALMVSAGGDLPFHSAALSARGRKAVTALVLDTDALALIK